MEIGRIEERKRIFCCLVGVSFIGVYIGLFSQYLGNINIMLDILLGVGDVMENRVYFYGVGVFDWVGVFFAGLLKIVY